MTTPGAALASLDQVERVVADTLRFKARLRIGNDAYVLSRLLDEGWRWWDAASAASTGAMVAKSALVAGTFFAPTGLLATLGLATAATPVGWVVAATVVAGGGWYGASRWWASQPNRMSDVIPRFINTPIDQLGLAVFDCVAGLALVVGRADGELSRAERDHLVDHLVADWGYHPGFVEIALPIVEREADAVAVDAAARAMARFVRANPDCNAAEMQVELLAFLEELMAADGRVDAVEQEAVRASGRRSPTKRAGRWRRCPRRPARPLRRRGARRASSCKLPARRLRLRSPASRAGSAARLDCAG